ncbi:MAG: ABC transporter ATP-binding protein [Myxococcales bacterium]|nr:ABC transporter ATP-binding protein [Myxococcales bacterium]|tara:strand:- start:2504 stop:3301 length:798 start_codon:yes stop_codon:yes gene_type:complete
MSQTFSDDDPTAPTAQMVPLIRYVGVQKAFADQVVYKDLSFKVFPGETICIIGPSGVGKSVMLKMLNGLLPVDQGEIFFDGQPLHHLRKDSEFLPIRKRVSMVFQGAALFDSLNVFDNLAYALREEGVVSETEIAARVQERLSWVDLSGIENKMPSELSGGMRKRVGLARSIMMDPEVVLYDEPTTGLDPVNCARIGELILSLHKRLNCTSLVVTHDVPVMKQIADRLVFVYDGRVVAEGTFDQLNESGPEMVREFLQGKLHQNS